MDNKIIRLVSPGVKILIAFVSLVVFILLYIFSFKLNNIEWYIKLFFLLLFIILLISNYLFYSFRIIINYKERKIYYYKAFKTTIAFSDIINLIIDTEHSINPKRYFNIIVICNDYSKLYLGQYISIINRTSWKRSQELVDLINKSISDKKEKG